MSNPNTERGLTRVMARWPKGVSENTYLPETPSGSSIHEYPQGHGTLWPLSDPPLASDKTAEACRRLFELMDRQPANQRQTTQDPHARMMAAYVAMFGQPREELDA